MLVNYFEGSFGKSTLKSFVSFSVLLQAAKKAAFNSFKGAIIELGQNKEVFNNIAYY